jgi:hypothetical protein
MAHRNAQPLVEPMPVVFESGDLDDDEIEARRELALEPLDLDYLDLERRYARWKGGEIVVRQALVGEGKSQQRMLAFGYVVGLPDGVWVVWKGTLEALERAIDLNDEGGAR